MEALMIRKSLVVLLPLVSVALAAPGWVQQPLSGSAVKKPAADPNERICENIYLGSRVRMSRFCGTRAEWQALRQADRQDVEKMQRPMQCNAVMGKTC
jgi:hypothetical protein